MKVGKSFEQMIEDIELIEKGESLMITGDDQIMQMFYVSDKLCESYPFLNNYYTLMHELMANAILRGNEKKPDLKVSVDVFLGRNGWILTIKDQGVGFDYETVLRTGEHCFNGQGLKMLKERDDIDFNYEDKGSTINLMVLYEKKN